ncbi:MAG: PKD domain-containing protein, partial [Acidobacteria bacterium]
MHPKSPYLNCSTWNCAASFRKLNLLVFLAVACSGLSWAQSQPDFIITAFLQNQPAAGVPIYVNETDVQLWVKIKNQGTLSTGTSIVRVRIQGSGGIDTTHGSYPQNLGQEYIVPVWLARFSAQGSYFLQATVDSDNRWVESNESNNTSTWIQINVLVRDTNPPPVPTLSSPANGQVFDAGSPYLSWNAVADPENNGVKYDCQVATSSSFSNVVRSQDDAGTGWTVQPALSPGRYYWHVRARDYVGNASAWSSSRYFDYTPPCPSLSSAPSSPVPAHQAQLDSLPGVFDWSDVNGATKYDVYLDGQARATNLASSKWTPSSLSGGAHSWYVVARNDCGSSSTGSTWTFTIDRFPNQPVLGNPANNGVTSDLPSFSWSGGTDPDGQSVIFDLYVSFPNSSSWKIIRENVSSPYTLASADRLDPGAVYKWQVWSRDPSGHTAISETRQFTVSLPQGAVAVNVRKWDGAVPDSWLSSSNSRVRLYRTTPSPTGFAEQTPINWVTTYSNLEPGMYRAEVRYSNTTMGLTEYWGFSSGVSVSGAPVDLLAKRTEPFISSGPSFKDSSGNPISAGASVPSGTRVFIDLGAFNPSASNRTVDIQVWGKNQNGSIQGIIGEKKGVSLVAMSSTSQASTQSVELTNLGSLGEGGVYLAPRVYTYSAPNSTNSEDAFTDVWTYPAGAHFTLVPFACPPVGAPATPVPTTGASLTAPPALLDWADVGGATLYDLYLDGGKAGSNLTASQWPVSSTPTIGLHRWYVVAKNDCGNATTGPTWTFTVSSSGYSVSGTVRSVRFPYSGVAGVTVRVDTGQQTTTDQQGCYILTGVAAGQRTLVASKADWWAQGVAAEANRTVSVSGDTAGTDFLAFACKATAQVALTIDKTNPQPGDTVNVTATLRNVNYSVGDVRAYLDLSFPEAQVTVGTPVSDSFTVSRYPSGSTIYRWDASGTASQFSSTEYLVSAERSGSYGYQSTYSFTVPLTIKTGATGTITLKYRGTIGDERDPDSAGTGVLDQQGLNVATASVAIVSSANDQVWQTIRSGGRTYTVHIVTESPLQNLDRPLSELTDGSNLKHIYVSDDLGQLVPGELAVDLLLTAQNAKKQLAAEQRSSTELLGYVDLVERGFWGVTYAVDVPSAYSGFFKWKFVFDGALSGGLDLTDSRRSRYKAVILDAVLQPDAYGAVTADQRAREALEKNRRWLSSVSGAVDVFEFLYEGSNQVLNIGQFVRFNEALASGVIPTSPLANYVGKFGVLLNAITVPLEFQSDVVRHAYRQICADADAAERLRALEAFAAENRDHLDPAFIEGLAEARSEFDEMTAKYYDQILKEAYLSSAVGNVVEFGNLFAEILGQVQLALPQAISKVALPYYLSWKIGVAVREQELDAQKACLAATLFHQLYRYDPAWLESYMHMLARRSSSGVLEAEQVKLVAHLGNIRYYLAWYFFDRYLETANNWVTSAYFHVGDWLTPGHDYADFVSDLEEERERYLNWFAVTQGPYFLTRHNDPLDFSATDREYAYLLDRLRFQLSDLEPAWKPVILVQSGPLAGQSPLNLDLATEAVQGATAFQWDFGDGTSDSTADPPIHSYARAGDYTVNLTVVRDGSPQRSTPLTVTVEEPPVLADFAGAPFAGAAPLTVQFANLSEGALTGNIWDFGDGTVSGAHAPIHTYSKPGTYSVELRVYGGKTQAVESKRNYVTVSSPTGAVQVTMNVAGWFCLSGPVVVVGSGPIEFLYGMPVGDYTIEYGPVAGYTTPLPSSQTLTAGGAIAFTGQYSETGSAIIAVAPETLSFGAVPVGGSLDQAFTVSNLGTVLLTGQASVAPPFSIVGTATYSVEPGQSHQILVRFSPAAAQEYSESVGFTGGSGANRVVVGQGFNSVACSPPSTPSLSGPVGPQTAPFVLSWTSHHNGLLYELQESTSSSFQPVSSYRLSAPTAEFPVIYEEGDYFYRVRAILGCEGKELLSPWSNVVVVTRQLSKLQVSPVERQVQGSSGTTSFSVSNTGAASMSWTASVVAGGDWLSINSGASGTDGGTITCSYTQNSGGVVRTGTIRVLALGALGSPKDVQVTQGTTSPANHVLTVIKVGGGAGWISSSPAGIDCGSSCSAAFPASSVVTLTASASPGSVFDGWSGEGCSGTGICQVAMTQAKNVAANFTLLPRTCNLTVPKPTPLFVGSEDHSANGEVWRNYRITVTNWASFPDELFNVAPDLPACGLNTESSRTWVHLYWQMPDESHSAYGYCALSGPSNLKQLRFATGVDEPRPIQFQLELWDRACDQRYTSDWITIPADNAAKWNNWRIEHMSSFDANGDGELDLLLATDRGLRLMRFGGGAPTCWETVDANPDYLGTHGLRLPNGQAYIAAGQVGGADLFSLQDGAWVK